MQNWIEKFDKLFDLPNYFVPTTKEPIYDLDKRKEQVKQFISDLLKERDKEWLNLIKETKDNYPEDVFTPLETDMLNYIHRLIVENCDIPLDRLSAHYARWMCDVILRSAKSKFL